MPEIYDNEDRAGENATPTKPKPAPSRPAPGTSTSAPLGPPLPTSQPSAVQQITQMLSGGTTSAPSSSSSAPAAAPAAINAMVTPTSTESEVTFRGLSDSVFSQGKKKAPPPDAKSDIERRLAEDPNLKRLLPVPPHPQQVIDTEQSTFGGVGAMGAYVPPRIVVDADATKRAQERNERKAEKQAPMEREMTWERYNNLTDKQRAAVDFNTMLVGAQQKDIRKADKYNPDENHRLAYDKAVTDIFGEGDGSIMFAPETVAVLQQIDFQSPKEGVGSDLDDFLNLKVAIKAKDLKDLGEIETPAVLASGGGVTVDQAGADAANELDELQVGLVEHTANLEKQLAESGQVLQNFREMAEADRNDNLGWFGGIPNKINVAPGFGVENPATATIELTEDDRRFQEMYDGLASNSMSTVPPDQIRAAIIQDLSAEGKLEAFMSFAQRRLALSERYDTPLGGNTSVQYKSPEQFRADLGLAPKAEPPGPGGVRSINATKTETGE